MMILASLVLAGVHGASIFATQPLGEVGLVCNVNYGDKRIFPRHFAAADGWAKHLRISIGLDQEGWDPNPERTPCNRLAGFVREAAQKGYKLTVTLGLPVPKSAVAGWRKIGEPGPYNGKRYGEMPETWWTPYVAWQKHASKVVVDAYGANASSSIRFMCLNEPYDRGEDLVVDRFIDYMVPRLLDSKNRLHGCPLDGPTLWGKPDQLHRQIDRIAALTKEKPNSFGRFAQIPLNLYLPHIRGPYRTVDSMITDYTEHVERSLAHAKAKLPSMPPNIAEFGVSKVWDSRPQIFADRHDDVAGEVIIKTLARVRPLGAPITIYQSCDENLEVQDREGFGLIDSWGNARIDFEALKRVCR